jgi:TetR/AcrR family transcriptional repressor of mexJK operon
MITVEPPEGDRGLKPEAVLAAAKTLFMERGYGATSMDDIAKRAKVGKATVYEHFQSKEELFAAVVNRECRGHAALVRALDPVEGDLRARLVRFARVLLDVLIRPEMIAIYRTIIAETVRAPQLGTAFYEGGPVRVRGALVPVLAEAARQGEIEADDPERAAVDLISLIRADLHLRALFAVPTLPGLAEKDELARIAVDRFLKAYAPSVA